MARIHGRRGRLYVDQSSGAAAAATPVAFLNSWSIAFETDKVEITAFDDTNKTYLSGLPDASGDFGGFYDDSTNQLYDAAIDGAARKFYLYPDLATSSKYWYGTAIFDFSVDGSVSDAVTVSGSWAAAGPISKNS